MESGARFGSYRIVAPLGAGGMGEVFRAHDDKLDRDVAIKVLPARLAADPDALARFEREARAVAALSHPNILSIHDFGEAPSTGSGPAVVYAVMELLEGQTLRQVLDDGALSPKKAIEFGRQIASGLGAAHGKGIIHRDLKPENLFVTRDGHVKILDFGLARQLVGAGSSSDATVATVVRGTEPGMVMGTVGYMAPEQVRGEVVDHRADIFAFGAVLYEMLTGKRAFERATSAETMTAILRDDVPPLTSVRETVPVALERVVEHCLEKRPEDRFQSVRDLGFALGASTSASGRSAIPDTGDSRPHRPSRAALLAAGALALGLLGGALLYRSFGAPPTASRPLDVRYLTYSGQDFAPSGSPDGRSVAFRSDRDGRARIWLKQLATGTEAPLTGGPLDDSPQFSPDGATVLFTRITGDTRALFRVPLVGGEPRRLVEDAADGSWSPDGSHLAFVRLKPAAPGRIASSSIIVTNTDGSSPRVLAHVDGAGIAAPHWSPDGKKISMTMTAVGAASFSLQVLDVATGAIETVVPANAPSRPWAARWLPSGRLVYTSGQITAGSLAGTTGRLLVLEPGSSGPTLLYASPDSLGHFAVLDENRLVTESQTFRQNVVEWSAGTPRRLSVGRAADRQPIYSSDGKWIVFSSDRTGNLDLWEAATTTGELRQLTDDPAADWDPAFTPDGRLLWSSTRSGNFEIWTAEADGSGARQLTHDGVDAENPVASPDGKWLVYGSTRPNQAGIWRARADGSDATLLVPGLLGIPDISPDSQYVLYLGFSGNLIGRGIRVARLADGKVADFEIMMSALRPTTANIGRSRWMPDGRAIAFVGQDEKGVNGIFAQDFVPGRDTTSTRRRLTGFDPNTDAETFGLSRDGGRVAIAGREMVSSLVLLEGLRRW